MTELKKKYTVWWHNETRHNDGTVNHSEQLIGTTYASSPRRAVSNMCFRNNCYKEQWNDNGFMSTTHSVMVAKEVI